MNDRDAFMAAITKEPDVDAHRLVFADWLEEHNDPLGEFIRVQCRLASGTTEKQTQILQARAEELLRLHQTTWSGPFGSMVSFHRGFPESLQATVDEINRDGDVLAATLPTVRHLRLSWSTRRLRRGLLLQITDDVDNMATSKIFKQIKSLEIVSAPAEILQTLFRHTNHLEELIIVPSGLLVPDPVDQDFIAWFVSAAQLRNLRILNLRDLDLPQRFWMLFLRNREVSFPKLECLLVNHAPRSVTRQYGQHRNPKFSVITS